MKEKIVKDTLFYSFSTFLAKIFGFIRSIIVARFLGPSLYGMWSALSIVLEYSRYSSLGVLNAMNREVPFYRGKKNNAKIEQIRNTGFTMACIPSFVIGFVLILVSIFVKGHVGAEWVAALRVIAILVFTKQLYDFFTLFFRSNNEFMFLGKLQLFFAAVDLVLIAVLVIRFGFYGFLWAIVLSYIWLISYIFSHVRRNFNFKLYFNRKLLSHLVKVGIFMTVIIVTVNLRTTVDRLMIVKFLGVTELGYFGISYVLIQFVFLIPSALSQIMYPRLVEKYGSSNKDTAVLRRYIEKSTLVLAYLMPVLIGEVFLFLPFGVGAFLPEYIPGVAAAQITILGLFFFSAETIAGNFLVTTNRLKWYFICAIIAVIFNFVLDYTFLKAGFGIKGVALGGVMITSFIYTSFVLGSVMFHYLKSGFKTLLYLVKIYAPFVYTLGILILLNNSNLHLFNKMAIFAVCCIPLVIKLERDTQAVSMIYGVVRGNIKGN